MVVLDLFILLNALFESSVSVFTSAMKIFIGTRFIIADESFLMHYLSENLGKAETKLSFKHVIGMTYEDKF